MRARALAPWAGVSALVAGCNLIFGIEEQPVHRLLVDASPPPDAADAQPPKTDKCTVDSECQPPNGCYTPHCDTTLGICTFALCESKVRSCAQGICDGTSFTCGGEADYGFRPSTFQVRTATLGCGQSATSCLGAAYPFLFIGTSTGVIAYVMDDLVSTAPRVVPIVGADVTPANIVTSGRRIFVIGAEQGTTAPYRLPISVIDVPSNPTVASLRATTTSLFVSFPKALFFPAPDSTIFVALSDPLQSFPTARLVPPLVDGAALPIAGTVLDAGSAGSYALYPTQIPDGGAYTDGGAFTYAGASGSRLVVARPPNWFGLATNPGTDKSAWRTAQQQTLVTAPYGTSSFSSGNDGTFLWTLPAVFDFALPDCGCRVASYVSWVYPSSIATNVETTQGAPYEVWYNAQAQPPVTCRSCTGGYPSYGSQVAWIDSRTALLATAASDPKRTKTSVRVITRDPPALPAARRTTNIPSANVNWVTDRLALTSSNKFGYLLTADSQGNNISISIFDPRCDEK